MGEVCFFPGWVFSLNSNTNFIFSTICFTNSTTHIFYLSFTTAPLRIEQSVQLKFYLGGIKWPRMGSSSKTESILNRFFPGLCNVDCGDFNMREYLSSHKLVIRDWCSRWNWHRCCRWYSRCYIVKIFRNDKRRKMPQGKIRKNLSFIWMAPFSASHIISNRMLWWIRC